MGLHAAEPGTRIEALEPIRQVVWMRFSSHRQGHRCEPCPFAKGSQSVAILFFGEICWSEIDSSQPLVRLCQGNSCADRFIRTIKENLLWLKTYSCIEYLQRACLRFKDEHDKHWLVECHGYRAPSQFTHDAMDEISIAA